MGIQYVGIISVKDRTCLHRRLKHSVEIHKPGLNELLHILETVRWQSSIYSLTYPLFYPMSDQYTDSPNCPGNKGENKEHVYQRLMS